MSLATFVAKLFSLEYTHGLIVRKGGRARLGHLTKKQLPKTRWK